MRKRYLSIVMVLCLVISMMPMMAFADDQNPRWEYSDSIINVTDYSEMHSVLPEGETAPDAQNIIWIPVARLTTDLTLSGSDTIHTLGKLIIPSGVTLTVENNFEAEVEIQPGGKVVVQNGGEFCTTMGENTVNNGTIEVKSGATMISQKGASIVNKGTILLNGIFHVGSIYDSSSNPIYTVWLDTSAGEPITGNGIVVVDPVEVKQGESLVDDNIATRIGAAGALNTKCGSKINVPIFITANSFDEIKELNGSTSTAFDGIYVTKGTTAIAVNEDIEFAKGLCVDWRDMVVANGKTFSLSSLDNLYFSGRGGRILVQADGGTLIVDRTSVISGDADQNAIFTVKHDAMALGAAEWAMFDYPAKAKTGNGGWYYVHEESGVVDAKGTMPSGVILPLLVDGTLNITGDFTYPETVEIRNGLSRANGATVTIDSISYGADSVEMSPLLSGRRTSFELVFDLNMGNGYRDIYDHLNVGTDRAKLYLRADNNNIPVTPARSGYTFNGWKATSKWTTAATEEKLAAFAVQRADGDTSETGWFVLTPTEFPVTMVAQWTRTSSGHSGGGGGGGSAAETPKDTTGVTQGTTTETKADGTAVTTTVSADGTKAVTAKSADGISQTVKTDAAGNMTEATATVPTEAIAAAIEAAKTESGQDTVPTVTLPTEVKAATTAETAAKVNIDLPASVSKENPAKVEIPIENLTAGIVAIIVNPDGTETILKTGALTEDGLAIELTGDTTIKIVDNTKEFSDVANDNWASNSIQFVAARGIFNGTGDGKFSPEETMSRGMLAKAFCNFAGGNETQNGTFGDATGKWYEGAANWAASLGIMNGSGSGFNGDAPIDREQLATSYYRLAIAQGKVKPLTGGKGLVGFGDAAAISDFAKEAVTWCVDAGLMNGMGGNINPKGLATRAQVSAMTQRYCAL